jgi:hypothetical protein
MSVRYPIATSAEEALKAPKGRAVRAREALAFADGLQVEFVRELVGPIFATQDAAEAAWPDVIDRQGAPAVQPEDRFCELMETIAPDPKAGSGQAEPTYEAGSRWPKPRRLLKTQWRLQVSYWRIVDPAAEAALPQARSARKSEEAQALDAKALRALARQPLQPVKPQQPLDIGLFEYTPPEAPHLTIPDE